MTDPDWPRDEYDCLMGPLLTLLDSGASADEIARYLQKETVEHIGLSAESDDFTAVVDRLRGWFDHGWRHLSEPSTIFVALLGEGVEVWRPVTARPLDTERFRIIGAEADMNDELWQFPAGAIVKCELKRFADGLSGLVAVEQVEEAGAH